MKNNAGAYRWRLKRQTPISGGTGYQDSGQTWYAMITDAKSLEADMVGTAIFQTAVVIRIRNDVTKTLTASDRLIDTSTDEIYTISGIQRDWTNNETVVLAERNLFGNVV